MELTQITKIFKALSCDQRLKLYKLLVEWEGFVSEDECCGVMKAFTKASEAMKISKSTISHHFKELENAGLISCTKNGQSVTCKINKEAIEEVKSYL
jgi:ArsR family transcriptional regulator